MFEPVLISTGEKNAIFLLMHSNIFRFENSSPNQSRGECQSVDVSVRFTWSIFSDVDEAISGIRDEHSSMFSKGGSTREERVVQGLYKEKQLKV